MAKSIEEGLDKLNNGQTAFYIDEKMLKGAIKQDPKLGENLITFGKTKPRYYGLIFNENSPLLPLFLRATTESLEEGQHDYLTTEWIGEDIVYEKSLNADVVGPGQVILVFAILTAMLTCSLTCLIFECIYFHVMKERLISRTPPHITPRLKLRQSQRITQVE